MFLYFIAGLAVSLFVWENNTKRLVIKSSKFNYDGVLKEIKHSLIIFEKYKWSTVS